MSTALALGRRTLQPASPLALQLTVCKHVALVPGPLGAPTWLLCQRGTFETLSLRAAWGPFVLFAVVRKDSPLHTAIDALQPEPQSGPGSSIDDQMLGY